MRNKWCEGWQTRVRPNWLRDFCTYFQARMRVFAFVTYSSLKHVNPSTQLAHKDTKACDIATKHTARPYGLHMLYVLPSSGNMALENLLLRAASPAAARKGRPHFRNSVLRHMPAVRGTTHADSAPLRAEPSKCIAKRNGAMRNTMVPIDKQSVMTKVGAHVCGCEVAPLNAQDKCYFPSGGTMWFVLSGMPPIHAPLGR